MERGDIRALFIVVFITQVFGNPAYYWYPQPDCYQANGYQQSVYQQTDYQPNGDQENAYQQQEFPQNTYQDGNQQTNNERNDYQDQSGYVYEKPTSNSLTVPYPPVPSYQETLQSMIDETIRALTEIVQVTVRASKQELSSLAKMFFESIPKTFCNTENESENVPDEYNGAEQYEGDQGNSPSVGPVRPLKGSLIEQGTLMDHTSSTTTPVPLSPTKPSSTTLSSLTTLSSGNSTATTNQTMSPTPSSSVDSTSLSSPSVSTSSTTLEESSQSMASNEEPSTTPGKYLQLSNVEDKSGIGNVLALNSSVLELPTTTQHSIVDQSNYNSSKVPVSSLSSINTNLSNTEMTTIHDISLTTEDISPNNANTMENKTHTSSSSMNETVLSNSTTPETAESDVTSEQSSSISENETFQSTLPLNTHITTTFMPTTLSDEAQNFSNIQNLSPLKPSLGAFQLNTTITSIPQNNSSDTLGDSTTELSNSTSNSTNLNKYEQTSDNDVNSDAIDFPRNPKL